MATAGPLTVDYREYGTTYRDETASPGYYAATLDRYGIRAEATATARTSAERYTFPEGTGHILLNLGEGLTNESGATVRRVSATEIEGSKLLGTFCYNPQKVFPVYFVLRVSRTPSASGYWKKQRPMTGVEAEWTPDNGKYKLYTQYGRELSGDDVGYWFTFDDLREGEEVEVRMGISYVSIDNARRNLDAEQAAGDSFDGLHAAAERRWNDDLSRIRVEGGTPEQRTVFYTALYHTLIHPNLLNDTNGEYPLMERSGETGVSADGDRYTVFSLWDTYRNVHQLLTLAYPERQLDMVRSMVAMSQEWGWLPKWELYGRETFTMEGDPAVPVLVDTWRKGLRDFDMEAAYAAMKRSATTPGAQNPMRPDIDPYIERGYIPLGYFAGDNSGDNSVSHALEYYVADAALAWLAAERGEHEFAAELRRRAAGWKHYYSEESGTLRPRNPDGEFLAPSIRGRARISSPFRVSTRVRPGTIRSSCPTTSRDWHVRWVASVSSWRSCNASSTRACTTLRTNPTSPMPTFSAASPARSGVPSARSHGCSTSTSPPAPTEYPETTTRAPCRPGPSSRCWGSIPIARASRTTRLRRPFSTGPRSTLRTARSPSRSTATALTSAA